MENCGFAENCDSMENYGFAENRDSMESCTSAEKLWLPADTVCILYSLRNTAVAFDCGFCYIICESQKPGDRQRCH